MSSSAITRLVSFLTRPLLKVHTPTTVVSVQICLYTALSSAPAPSSLFLSANSPPPAAIQRACLVSGIRWAEWIRLLSSGIDVRVFITESSLAVELGRMPRRTIWLARDNACAPAVNPIPQSFRSSVLLPTGARFGARLRATLASARARNCRGAALNPTRIPTLLSTSYNADDLVADSDDSDSDSDSDASSDSGCSFTSASSATSVSTTSASPHALLQSGPSGVKQYMYQGGVTKVMSGGVMLGASSKPRRSAIFAKGRPSGMSGNAARKTGVSAVDSWRKSA